MYDNPAQEADFQAARPLFVSPPPSQRKLGFLVASLVFFAVVWMARGGGSYVDLALVVGVLLVHEAGHAAAMLVFGYRDVKIFFIPLFGAAASGRPRGVARWRQAIVLLAGPVPGLMAGCLLRYVAAPGSTLMHLALVAILVNAINLLPVEPLDGGRLFQVLVFSRNRHLEVMFRVVTAALVVVISVYLHLWALAIFGYLVLVTLPQNMRILAAAEPLKLAGLPDDPAQLDEPQQRALHTATWNTFSPQAQAKLRGKPAPQAFWMEQLHQRAVLRAPSWLATAAVLAVWATGTGLALYTVMPLVHRTVTWHSYQRGSFTVDIPVDARVIADKPTYLSFTDDHSVLGIRYETIDNPALDYVHEIEARLATTATPTEQPHEFVTPVKGRSLRLRVIAPGADRVGYTLEAWPDDAIGRHFLDSFRSTPP